MVQAWAWAALVTTSPHRPRSPLRTRCNTRMPTCRRRRSRRRACRLNTISISSRLATRQCRPEVRHIEWAPRRRCHKATFRDLHPRKALRRRARSRCSRTAVIAVRGRCLLPPHPLRTPIRDKGTGMDLHHQQGLPLLLELPPQARLRPRRLRGAQRIWGGPQATATLLQVAWQRVAMARDPTKVFVEEGATMGSCNTRRWTLTWQECTAPMVRAWACTRRNTPRHRMWASTWALWASRTARDSQRISPT
mmetsp:Transcript_26924/g.51288  ORF Transcript_26924/g.51288 Transcript_26924/m.51288 type:complete len:250 (+) Transcript_26924:2846-3595(+)